MALALAVAAHLSAVAIAARHHEVPAVPGGIFTDVVIDQPVDDPPSTPPIEIPLLPPPPSIVPEEFIEPQPVSQRTPVQHSHGPIRTPGIAPTAGKGNFRAYALSAPRPEYPYEARSRHLMGSGLARLTVDPVTGSVIAATMQQSIGNALLDNSALSAFRRWRFRRGTPVTVIIPITYDLAGPSY